MRGIALALIRHAIGYGLVFPSVLLAVLLQALVMRPVLGDRFTLPHIVYRASGALFGIRFRVNPQSAPFTRDAPVMYVANHLSRIDFAALQVLPDAAVMMNAMFFRMPVLGPVIRLFAYGAGIIGTDQSQDGKRHDLNSLAKAMQDGRNIFLFPEGIQTDGLRVLRFSRGAAEIFYDPELKLEFPRVGTALVQPIAFRVSRIEGADVLGEPARWGRYTLSRGRTNIFLGAWRLSHIRSIEIDLLVCEPLDPKAYDTAEALMNAAQERIRRIIAPEQTQALTRQEWRRRLDVRDFSV